MDELVNYHCIDFRKLLIVKAKSLKISDDECYMLLLIMTMQEIGVKSVTPSQIQKISSLPIQKIDKVLLELVDHHYVKRDRGHLDLKPLYQLLLQQEVEIKEETNLISVFENAFGRGLNQMELEIINNFKRNGYDDSMILDALNESVKSGVINFRYIEKILDNWSKYGVKRRFASPVSSAPVHNEVNQDVKDLKWWDDNE